MSEVDGEEGPPTSMCHGGMWYREAGPPTYKCQKWMERKVHQLLCGTGVLRQCPTIKEPLLEPLRKYVDELQESPSIADTYKTDVIDRGIILDNSRG